MERKTYSRRKEPTSRPRKSPSTEVKRYVRKTIASAEETKYVSANGTGVVLTGTPVMGAVGLIAQGVTVNTRSGNRITIVGVDLKVVCECNVLAASRLRIMLIRDKQPNGALPGSATDFFMDKTAANSFIASYDPSTVGTSVRYEVLHDQLVCLNIAGGAANFAEKNMDVFTTRKKRIVVYNNTTAAIGDCNVGSILFCLFTDVAANGPLYTYEFSQRFKDA